MISDIGSFLIGVILTAIIFVVFILLHRKRHPNYQIYNLPPDDNLEEPNFDQ